ncbi:Putative transport protein RP630 [Durusdinium trenchii]|uniref:Transport protein RP630 n=1 Tax=Durusdinium trenchii TaxID=1381693 RepID=A0ABP0SR29_9DINO
MCRCNLQPLKLLWQQPQDGAYIALEQSYIPEEVLLEWKESEGAGKNCFARVLALAFVLSTAGMGILMILGSIITSLEHVNMKTYQQGFNQLESNVLGLLQNVNPKLKAELARRMNTLESHVANMLISTLNDVLTNTTSFATQLVMFLLYSLMCLLSPLKSGEQVFTIVRTYFGYKAACNAAFSFCVWCLLAGIGGCDLAVVLSVMCFFLSFIPEVGSVICMLLPIPVLLFDSRVTVEVRGANVLTMVLGMLGIKFAVSNGLESLVMSRSAILSGNLDEEQPGAETHPVLILFAVVLCGQIWGVTGMLISVPLLSLVRLLLNLEAMKQHRAMADAQQRRLSYIGEVAKQSNLLSRNSSRPNSRLYTANSDRSLQP